MKIALASRPHPVGDHGKVCFEHMCRSQDTCSAGANNFVILYDKSLFFGHTSYLKRWEIALTNEPFNAHKSSL